jgi:hypothetical protein
MRESGGAEGLKTLTPDPLSLWRGEKVWQKG